MPDYVQCRKCKRVIEESHGPYCAECQPKPREPKPEPENERATKPKEDAKE